MSAHTAFGEMGEPAHRHGAHLGLGHGHAAAEKFPVGDAETDARVAVRVFEEQHGKAAGFRGSKLRYGQRQNPFPRKPQIFAHTGGELPETCSGQFLRKFLPCRGQGERQAVAAHSVGEVRAAAVTAQHRRVLPRTREARKEIAQRGNAGD
jgi:hypothetical protein